MLRYSYHACCGNFFKGGPCMTDNEMEDVISRNEPKRSFDYDYIILDEVQDMKFIYFNLIKLLCSHKKAERMALFGDKRQTIYDHGKTFTDRSDCRFLTLGDQVFKDMTKCEKWEYKVLNETWRLTPEMCNLLNKAFIKEDILTSGKKKSGIKPIYKICNIFSEHQMIIDMIEKDGYKPEDIFILASSVTNDLCPAKKLLDTIKAKYKNKYNFYVSGDDKSPINEETSKGKIVISTFHKTKGLERKVVFFLNMDTIQVKLFRATDSEYLLNKFYVGLTRAKERLYILHHCENDYLKCVNQNLLKEYSIFSGSLKNERDYKIEVIDKPVTKLLKHLSQSKIDQMDRFYTKILIKDEEDKISLQNSIKCKFNINLSENVAPINGLVIPLYFQGRLEGNIGEIKFDNTFKVKDLLEYATKLKYSRDGYNKLKFQIDHYDWLSLKDVLQFDDFFKDIVGKNKKILFEKDKLIEEFSIDNGDNHISRR